MSSWVIDDDGQLWDAASPRLMQRMGCRRVSGDLNDYFVRNLGYIHIEYAGPCCKLFVNPIAMTDAAFATLVFCLSDQMFEFVDLALFDEHWQNTRCATLRDAIDELMRLMSLRAATKHSRFMSERKILGDLVADHPLSRLHQLWRALSGRFDRKSYIEALGSLVNARYMVITADRGSSDLYFNEVGRGVRFYDHFWHVRTVGLRLQDQPDYDLGQWVTEAYRDAMVSDCPRLDNVDIIASRPRQDAIRIRYTRIMLPLQDQGQSTSVLSASFLDDTVDLRVC